MKYRVWYSTESLADFIIDHTSLKDRETTKRPLFESDASKPRHFHSMPEHLKKILYLDSPDLIVECDNEPIFSLEISSEAGTGHNAFQRFARLAASVENQVPAFYIYPEAVIIKRRARNGGSSDSIKWDRINPLIFKALTEVMSVYDIPALLYFFPSDYAEFGDSPEAAPNYGSRGLRYSSNYRYAACPKAEDAQMADMFGTINELISSIEDHGIHDGRSKLMRKVVFRRKRSSMEAEFNGRACGRPLTAMSPLTSVVEVPTPVVIDYVEKCVGTKNLVGELLRGRPTTYIYRVNAKFRGDPYPGALSAIDYLLCREGLTLEDRKANLVMAWGNCVYDEGLGKLVMDGDASIDDFSSAVSACEKKNLLTKPYGELAAHEIPRYYMQVRYGSTYSKVKHIRVYSYFADAILFPDGAVWRDG